MPESISLLQQRHNFPGKLYTYCLRFVKMQEADEYGILLLPDHLSGGTSPRLDLCSAEPKLC